MKKIGNAYEDKNKLIQEIQKNLRTLTKNLPSSSQRYHHHYFGSRLPTIAKRKSLDETYLQKNDKKQSLKEKSHFIESNIPEVPVLLSKKAGIKTIIFKQNEMHNNQTFLLIKHRSTMKKFKKTANKFKVQSDGEQCEKDSEIFLTPRKFLHLSKSKSLLNQQQKQKLNQKKSEENIEEENKNKRKEKILNFFREKSEREKKKEKEEIENIFYSDHPLNRSIQTKSTEFEQKSFEKVSYFSKTIEKIPEKKNPKTPEVFSPWVSEPLDFQSEIWQA